jgi:hypothetical protein
MGGDAAVRAKEDVPMCVRIAVLISLAALAIGCASVDERVSVTPASGVERIPTKIAVYPLLTSEMPQIVGQPRYSPASVRSADDKLYIVAPAETKLVSTMESQLLTSMLSARLSDDGFTLKELPVEAPSEQSERAENSFFVSLATLKELREDYGLEAILVGNAYFIKDARDPSMTLVRAAYLRLVDTETLDVLCHVSISDKYGGDLMEEAAEALALALAKQAKLVAATSR